MKRRTFLLGAGGAAVAGTALLRPGDHGAAYEDYFRQLNAELTQNGPSHPVMLLDLDRVDHNIDRIAASMAGKSYRVVAKSLPSPKLIDYVFKRARTNRLMSFHRPFLNDHARLFPDADALLGKPMPARAADRFYAELQSDFDPQQQLQWLLDTPARLNDYLAMAEGRDLRLNINIELDVGLHRGGVTAGEDLAAMLQTIASQPDRLRLSGFMGYDPHVVKVPSIIASREALFDASMSAYAAALEQLRSSFPALDTAALTLNTAGSPTYELHQAETLCNDIAVGSAVVKPLDFDIDTLSDHRPACFIASPVLKLSDKPQLAGIDDKAAWLAAWDVNQQRSHYIYGGYWKAEPVSPAGMQLNALFGRSTNQELLNSSPRTALKVDDNVFLRPTQSEFVFLQFGALLAVRDGRIVDEWPLFTGTA